jgi:predicted thioesterase
VSRLESNFSEKSASNPSSSGDGIRPGLESRVELRVGEGELASSIGNPGATVLATPILIGLLENASTMAVRPYLPTGKLTVGTRVNVQHLAATPPGFTVVARTICLEYNS